MANTISFIHCADLHFDTAFSGLSSVKATIRREELRQTFLRILNICQEKNVDFLFLSGDLFDSTRVTDETIAFIQATLESFLEIQVFIAPGNHDPYMPGTRYDNAAWPKNVTIFRQNEIQKYTITTKQNVIANIYGAAFTTPYVEKCMLDDFSIPSEGQTQFHVMTIHGDLVTPGQNSVYHPIPLQTVAQSHLDYLALGHKHTATQPEKHGQTYVSYSGAPEGRGFDELGEKGVWYVSLTKETNQQESSAQYEWIPCAARTYELASVDITGCSYHHAVMQRITDAIKNPANLYKIVLTGVLKDGFLLDLNAIQAGLADLYFFVKLKDETRTEVDIETLAKENMLRGIFTRRLLAKIEEAKRKGNTKEEALYTDALTLGLRAFEGEVSVYDYQINQN